MQSDFDREVVELPSEAELVERLVAIDMGYLLEKTDLHRKLGGKKASRGRGSFSQLSVF